MTNWVRLRNFTLAAGLVIVGIGVIFMLVGTFCNIYGFIEAAKWVLSMGLGITSLGIASHSIVISEESDKKMTALSNAFFIELIDNFKTYFDGSIIQKDDDVESYHTRNDFYKWRTDIKKAMEFINWATKDQQTALTHLFVSIFEKLPWNKKLITNSDVRHLLGMCGNIVNFEITPEDYTKLMTLSDIYFGKRQKGEDYIPYINRKIVGLKPKLEAKYINQIFKK